MQSEITAEEFMMRLLEVTNLPYSYDNFLMMSIDRAVEMIYNDGNPYNDSYAEAIQMCESPEQLKKLINQQPAYLTLFLSAAIVLVDELTVNDIWDEEQKAEINYLLDQIEPFLIKD